MLKSSILWGEELWGQYEFITGQKRLKWATSMIGRSFCTDERERSFSGLLGLTVVGGTAVLDG